MNRPIACVSMRPLRSSIVAACLSAALLLGWTTLPAQAGGTHACCRADGSCFNDTSCANCLNNNLDPSVACFDGVECDSNPCPAPTGACCLNEECSERTASNCLFLGGTYRGHGSRCDTVSCSSSSFGACCPSGGGCHDGLSESFCVDNPISGEFHYGASCLPSPCDGTTGACCTDDGCFEVTTGECATLGGVYNGDDTTCDPTQCPFPPGACCFSNGSCSEITRDECIAQDGVYHGNHTACGFNSCGGLGACCSPFGTCEIDSPAECEADSGIYIADTACSLNPCPAPTGACCLNEECSERTASNCLFLGGTYRGHGSRCDTVSCSSSSFGACCPSGGGCHDGLSESFCVDNPILGEFHYGTSCLPSPCGGTTGACCTNDGCFEVTSVECATLHGTYDGDNTVCDPTTCPFPPGACCFSNGSCSEITRDDCITQDGVYHGNHAVCGFSTCGGLGACCSPFGTCEIDSPAGCEADSGIYIADTACSLNPCPAPTGACCFNEECSERTASDCLFLGGTYRGHGSRCDTVSCSSSSFGACCPSGGVCHDGLSESFCVDNPILGEFHYGTSCLPSPCGGTTGACCTNDGCFEVTSVECATLHGTYDGDNTVCDPTTCPFPPGACCFSNGSCSEITRDECIAQDGVYHGNHTACGFNSCGGLGACCSPFGTCEIDSPAECEADSGIYIADTACSLNPCPAPTGACCLNEECSEGTASDCLFLGGTYRGHASRCDTVSCSSLSFGACCPSGGGCHDGLSESFCVDTIFGEFHYGASCLPSPCGEVTGACCTDNGCFEVSQDGCQTLGGVYEGDGSTCANILCEQVLGACCFLAGPGLVAGEASCENAARPICARLGGEFQGLGTSCEDNGCPASRVSATQKGSLLLFSNVELAWEPGNVAGPGFVLTQDTVIELTNDYPLPVDVQLYFVNGDAPLDPVFAGDPPMLVIDGEPGWNWVDCQLKLTQDQPTYWSAATGLPAGCQPFTVLDPDTGNGPGRPDVENPGRRVLRGFIYAWAVDSAGRELSWNHLSGSGTLISYADQSAWEYEAWGFQSRLPHGAQTELPGVLLLNGIDYDMAFDMLLLDFFASGSQALSANGAVVTADTDLTLQIVSADLRQDSLGPITTKAEFAIWNENETRFSGTTRCITCWDQTLLSNYATPNHFLLGNLQTNRGKARINGVASDVCDVNCILEPSVSSGTTAGVFDFDVVCSQYAALLGVSAKVLAFSGTATGRTHAGGTLVGQGQEPAFVVYDIIDPPGTATKASRPLRSGSR